MQFSLRSPRSGYKETSRELQRPKGKNVKALSLRTGQRNLPCLGGLGGRSPFELGTCAFMLKPLCGLLYSSLQLSLILRQRSSESKKDKAGDPTVVKWGQLCLGSYRDPGLTYSGLGIQCCHTFGLGHNCGSNLIPDPGAPYISGRPKMTKKKKKRTNQTPPKKEAKRRLLELNLFFALCT